MFLLKDVRYKHVLDVVELEIAQGRIHCVYGESGAGKTTLLRLLNHLIAADHGIILYKGEDVTGLDPIKLRREVVMLPQTPIVFDGTIRDNLLIGLRFSEKPIVSDEVLLSVLQDVHLHKELGADARKLSGGEQQRMALARVLLLQPEVLLLDEPSAALDEDTESLVIEQVVKYVKRHGKTLVMITHAKRIVEQYGEYTIELVQGKVKEVREVSARC